MPEFEITLKCGTRLSCTDLETAGLSYVPCGKVNGEDQPLFPFAHLWGDRQQVTLDTYGRRANAWSLSRMNGVQLMTGTPSFRTDTSSPDGYLYLTDVDIERRLIDTYPGIVDRIVDVFRYACDRTPCIIATKSDGRRLSAFVPYLDSKQEFKDAENAMLLEIFSVKGLSRLDDRYAVLDGSILDLPVIPKSALQEIHRIISEVAIEKNTNLENPTSLNPVRLINSLLNGARTASLSISACHCQATSHKNSERLTVQFQRYRGGVQGHCFNCGESGGS